MEGADARHLQSARLDYQMRIIAYIGVSLDGYIADLEGNVDWLHEIPIPEGNDLGFSTFMAGIDAVLMGSNTFRAVLDIGEWYYDKPVYVASNSFTKIPVGYENRIQLIQGTIHELIEYLRESGFYSIYVDGGKIIQGCLNFGILNEIIITHVPVLLGAGIPFLNKLSQSIDLEHVHTAVLEPGLVKSHYHINRRR
jgi:dihydrofolate reductase